MYTRIHVYMYICIYVDMYTCIHVCMYICIHLYMYTCIYVYMYIYICIHTCIQCIDIHIPEYHDFWMVKPVESLGHERQRMTSKPVNLGGVGRGSLPNGAKSPRDGHQFRCQ